MSQCGVCPASVCVSKAVLGSPSTPSNSSSDSSGSNAGLLPGLVGGLVGLLVIAVFAYAAIRYKRRKAHGLPFWKSADSSSETSEHWVNWKIKSLITKLINNSQHLAKHQSSDLFRADQILSLLWFPLLICPPQHNILVQKCKLLLLDPASLYETHLPSATKMTICITLLRPTALLHATLLDLKIHLLIWMMKAQFNLDV